MVSTMGMKTYSFDDLEHIDLDSVDSICLSDSTSATPKTLRSQSSNSNDSSFDLASNFTSESSECNEVNEYAKRKVLKLLKSIRKLEKLHEKRNEPKMPMLVFMDVIRDQQYKHVYMNMLGKFMETCKMVPRAYYFHYYMFFLHYAEYYHFMRSTADVIDKKMKEQHRQHFICIRAQLKYLYYIIKESRLRDLTQEITL